jgi:hypothetical protein
MANGPHPPLTTRQHRYEATHTGGRAVFPSRLDVKTHVLVPLLVF